MTIDFHSPHARGSYAHRQADADWKQAMLGLVDPAGKRVADIGCGGGIYTRAWRELGARSVTGVDYSAEMIADALQTCTGDAGVSFRRADAAATGLPEESFDIVFSRALIHHLPQPGPAIGEAFDLLIPGGMVIIQDRTIDDIRQSASPTHLRGYFFELFPRLLEVEQARRPASAGVVECLRSAGFNGILAQPLYEQRRIYTAPDQLEADLRARTGRSILHELDDDELEALIAYINERVAGGFPFTEVDRWTVWSGQKP